MTGAEIATLIAAATALSEAITRMILLLQDQELSDDQKEEIRVLHEKVQAETSRLTPIPPPPEAP